MWQCSGRTGCEGSVAVHTQHWVVAWQAAAPTDRTNSRSRAPKVVQVTHRHTRLCMCRLAVCLGGWCECDDSTCMGTKKAANRLGVNRTGCHYPLSANDRLPCRRLSSGACKKLNDSHRKDMDDAGHQKGLSQAGELLRPNNIGRSKKCASKGTESCQPHALQLGPCSHAHGKQQNSQAWLAG